MKDFIVVSLALTAAAGVSRSDVFGALKASNNDPEALATNLLQYGEASDTRDAGDCANMTGYEHCTKCAMPSIQNLVTSLVAVKTEIWTDQKTIADQAANVCNDANPAGRYGGNAKCCAAATTASKYVPAGFAGCTAETFSLESTTPVAVSTGTVGEADASSNLKYNRDHGFYFEGSGTVQPSSVIQDCCSSTSTCQANEKTLHATAAAAIADLNTAKEAIEAATASNQATEMQIELQQAKLDRTNAGIRKICLATDHVDGVFAPSTSSTTNMPIDGDTTDQIAAKCPGDCQIKTIVDRQAARKVKISAHKAATEKTFEVIQKVIKWLDANIKGNGAGADNIFDSHNNTRDGGYLKNGVANADGFDSSLALLESAAAQTTNADALASLKQATSLLQGAGRDGGTGTGGMSKVIELLQQILTDFDNQINQLDTYNTQMDTEEDTELSNMRGQIVNLEAERTAAISKELTLQSAVSAFATTISTQHAVVDSKMGEWVVAYKQKEANAEKCKNFMTFFDAETLVNTEELLVLKMAIDIIKHITCGTSQAPTAAPTAFPTVFASAASGAPTAFPTRSPTAAPTAPPSDAALANDVGCDAGAYRFLSKVYSDPARYSVPSYTDGIRYALAAGDAEACQLIKTSHTNIEGAVQTIDHQYKCCGGNGDVSGSFYGAVSYDSVKADGSLCGADVADHCGLFGANMYMGDTEPNATATQGTFTPTAEPTAYPTRVPTEAATATTAAPTVADRTDAPTAAPTAFPTAVHHEGRDVEILQQYADTGNMSKHDAGKYNITRQSLRETAAPTGFPTAYPTASPTKAPTAYPTPFPTPFPTPAPTCYNGAVSVPGGAHKGGWSPWTGRATVKCTGTNEVFNGLWSTHDNGAEARDFIPRCTTVSVQNRGGDLFGPEASVGWSGGADNAQHSACPAGSVMTGFISDHNNHYKDRDYEVWCKPFLGNLAPSQSGEAWTGYVNNYDGTFDYTAPAGQMLRGMASDHNNHHEDRIFQFLTSTTTVTAC